MTKSFDQHAEEIREALVECARPWLEVARRLKAAHDDGIVGAEMERLCESVGLGYEAGTKLLKIATSQFIQDNLSRLGSESWTTLYQIALLKPEETRAFELENLGRDENPRTKPAPITRAKVQAYRKPKGRSRRQALQALELVNPNIRRRSFLPNERELVGRLSELLNAIFPTFKVKCPEEFVRQVRELPADETEIGKVVLRFQKEIQAVLGSGEFGKLSLADGRRVDVTTYLAARSPKTESGNRVTAT